MARVLVTGGRGLLGSTLVPTLRRHGHEVRLLGRGSESQVRADLTDRAATERVLAAEAPEIIVNLAAETSVDACEHDPAHAFAANAASVESIASWIGAGTGGCHLLQVSTDQVYDGPGPHGERAVRPINYYAYSKLAGELYASRIGATVVRTNLFGRSLAAGRTSLSDWLVTRLRSGERTPVFTDVLFTPLSLTSLAELLALLIERRPAGTFNLGSRAGMSKADFAYRLAKALGLPTAGLVPALSTAVGLSARRPLDMRMDCALIESRLGITLPALDAEIESMRSVYADQT